MADLDHEPPWMKGVRKRTDAFRAAADAITNKRPDHERQAQIQIDDKIRKHRPQPMLTPHGVMRRDGEREAKNLIVRQKNAQLLRAKLDNEHRSKVSFKDIFNERSRG